MHLPLFGELTNEDMAFTLPPAGYLFKNKIWASDDVKNSTFCVITVPVISGCVFPRLEILKITWKGKVFRNEH